MWADDKQGGKLTSTVTPINPTETVTITYDGTGTNFANWQPKCFIHTWLVNKTGETFSGNYNMSWASCNGDNDYNNLPAKVKMTFVSNGKYSISMNIKEFFDVADEDLAKIEKIGVIVRAQYSGDNNQTNDFFINVEYENPEEPEQPETPVDSTTMYFVNVPGWTTVKAFVWPATGNAYKEWSGEAMTKTETKVNGFDVYSYTFPSNFVNIIFNDGGSNQTADLAWSEDKPYFYPEEKSDGKYNTKWYASTSAIPAIEEPTMKTVKLVPSEEWLDSDAKFAAWIWGKNVATSHWTSFFTPVSEGNDTLQAEFISTADSIAFIRFSPKATEPTWDKVGGYTVVWGETKDKIDYSSLVWTVVGWDAGQWTPVEKPCKGYGLLVDGEEYLDAKHNVMRTEWTEYYLRSVHLKKGQTLKIKNKCNSDAWVITKFADTSYELEIKDGSYVIAEEGDYDFYFKFIFENDEIYISKAGMYTTAVRSQCTDVMIQAFYNESYNENAGGVSECGKTRWWNFLNDTAYDGGSLAAEIGRYFDLVWLPPSAEGSGMGYHPKRYSNQNSTWGTADELAQLISTLHDAGSKVVADIVINHCEGWSSWCDFPAMDFGEYGTFYPDQTYICKNDEVNGEWNKASAGSCYGKASGSNDDGENWDGARDWSHNDVYVQDMFKAYLKWMRNVVGYDGFRYDKGDGFNNWHHDNYNKAAGPYIAFMECYSNTDEIWGRIQAANYNIMGLDFDTKWHVFDAFAGWDYNGKYGKPRGDGLLGRNNGRYAVTFIDSHDWFRRNNGCEFGGEGNSLTKKLLPRLLVANAFMLSMPGVPCVFYPHWAKNKGYLKNMIKARKLAGVHSESEVKDEYATESGYQATIVGKDGYLILCLGDKAHQNFAGYTLMSSYYAENDCGEGKDGSHQIWVKRTTPLPTGVENTNNEPAVKAEKFMKDGKLFIRLGERVFDVTGARVK